VVVDLAYCRILVHDSEGPQNGFQNNFSNPIAPRILPGDGYLMVLEKVFTQSLPEAQEVILLIARQRLGGLEPRAKYSALSRPYHCYPSSGRRNTVKEMPEKNSEFIRAISHGVFEAQPYSVLL